MWAKALCALYLASSCDLARGKKGGKKGGGGNGNGNTGGGPPSCSFCSDSIGTRSLAISGNDSLCDGGFKIESEPTQNSNIMWTNFVNGVQCTLIISNIE